MIYILIIGICLSPFWQPDKESRNVAALCALFAGAHAVMSIYMSPQMYFGTGALFSMILVLAISHISISDRAFWLQTIACLSILGNYFGWVLWRTYQPLEAYTALYLILDTLTLMILLGGANVWRDIRRYLLGLSIYRSGCARLRRLVKIYRKETLCESH